MQDNKNFNDLYAFVQVVRFQNFNRAAKALGVHPSALSHRMNDLENRLNIKLLNRTTRSMSPTEAGQQLYDRISPMFGVIQDELAALGDFQQQTVGKLRINSSENPAHTLLYPKMREFLAAHPAVEVEIMINNNHIDIVKEGFDFGVRPMHEVAQDMVAVQISEERQMGIVASPAYLKRCGTPQTLQDLTRHRCIVISFNSFSRLTEWEFLDNNQLLRINAPASLTFNSSVLIKQALLDGLGLSWAPIYAVEQELASGELVELFADKRITYPPMGLYYPKNRHKTQAAQAWIEMLKLN